MTATEEADIARIKLWYALPDERSQKPRGHMPSFQPVDNNESFAGRGLGIMITILILGFIVATALYFFGPTLWDNL